MEEKAPSLKINFPLRPPTMNSSHSTCFIKTHGNRWTAASPGFRNVAQHSAKSGDKQPTHFILIFNVFDKTLPRSLRVNKEGPIQLSLLFQSCFLYFLDLCIKSSTTCSDKEEQTKKEFHPHSTFGSKAGSAFVCFRCSVCFCVAPLHYPPALP